MSNRESLLEKSQRGENENLVSDDSIDDDPLINTQVGKYKILRELGEGRMGWVYLATRADGSFRKLVALKIVRRGMDTDFILRRFRQERQVLALLNHPYITPLLDGGTIDGLPYLVMDYIEGEPLYKYAEEQNLSVSDRLRLFLRICDAVEYAHQNQVIHRELKPSNILIKKDGTPRLLDFGVAKVLNPELQEEITLDPTLPAMQMMTPEYASPEQIKGETVTKATDIYSLGVMLYELLTGHLPFRLENCAAHEVARVICEAEPLPPSAVSEEKNTDSLNSPSSLHSYSASELKGDLEKIILKSLRKSPSERYASVAEFAADIENYLEKRPVIAEDFIPAKSFTSKKTPTTRREKYSIAILPLTIISTGNTGDAGEEYLGIGLADALILRLSNVQRFVVRPTSSVLRFQNGITEPFQAGRELNVEFLVEGTIRRFGERIRVSISLLSIKDKSIVWAEKFDENFTDVLELEDSISERVAKSLIPHLTSEEEKQLHKRGTNSPEAYEAYLRGRYFANQFTDIALLKSIESYREAIRLDPDYAMPHFGIADFYVLMAIFGAMPCREAYPLAKESLDHVLQVDDSVGDAYALLAFIAILYDWDWAKSEHLVKRALELNPNTYLAHDVNAHILASQGIKEPAVSEIRHSEKLDPLAPRAKLMTSCILYQTGNYDKGAAKAEAAVRIQGNSPQAFLHFGNSLTHSGDTEKAIEVLSESAKLLENSALPRYMLSFALVADGRREEAERVLESVLDLTKRQYVKPYFVAMTFAALGKIDEAFEWFEKSIEERDEWMIWFGTDIKLDVLRKDKRYFEILRKTNNPIIERQLAEEAN